MRPERQLCHGQWKSAPEKSPVQEDWIEHGIAAELEEAGVPKSAIVLGFQPPYVRPYTEYAAA